MYHTWMKRCVVCRNIVALSLPYMPSHQLLTVPQGTANAGTKLKAFRNSTDAIIGVAMLTKDGNVLLSEQCTRVLLYPHQV